jgi:hypothetical protein
MSFPPGMIRAPRADLLLALANLERPVHEHSPLAAVSTICSWFVLDPLDILIAPKGHATITFVCASKFIEDFSMVKPMSSLTYDRHINRRVCDERKTFR